MASLSITTAHGTRHVGDRVSIDHPKYPGVWILKSIAKVNVTLEPENGGRGLRVPASMLLDAGASPTMPDRVTAADIYAEGTFVRIPSGKFAGVWVVISDKGADRLNVAKLGGDGGRYVRITRRGLTKVDPADVVRPEFLD